MMVRKLTLRSSCLEVSFAASCATIYWGALALWAERVAVLLSGSLGGLKPGSCYLKKDFALSLGVGSPSPTETFLRILVILAS